MVSAKSEHATRHASNVTKPMMHTHAQHAQPELLLLPTSHVTVHLATSNNYLTHSHVISAIHHALHAMVKELHIAHNVSRIRNLSIMLVSVTMASSQIMQTMALSAVLVTLLAILAKLQPVMTVCHVQLIRNSSPDDVSPVMLTAKIAMVKPLTNAQLAQIMLNSLSLEMVMFVLARLVLFELYRTSQLPAIQM